MSKEDVSTGTYLDFAATTPVDARVAELVLRLMRDDFANAGSRTHEQGVMAAREVAKARERVAAELGAAPEEVVFTSGATESSNIAILGLARADRSRRHIVTTAIEHAAVHGPVDALEADGFEVSRILPNHLGRVVAADVLAAVRPDTLLVSVMHANNETGAVQPIVEIAGSLPAGPAFHVDAAQTFGRLSADLHHDRVDLASVSGHKIYAPKGVGALMVRQGHGRPAVSPIMHGGGQERGLRPGTVPVALVAGLGLAAELAGRERDKRSERCAAIRSDALRALAPLGAVVHGRDGPALPHILGVAFPGVDSEALMVALRGVAAISNGSACTSALYRPSHVLEAMDLPDDVVRGTVRFSWSHNVSPPPWDAVAAIVRMLS
ncbi:aminotransferase class V-fold PLP-dependent enzyme [Sphingomonas sp.]|uniref:aminotransferase class V-fold PLP-dependent enzyme n=1 Tax=Sphingomonas sp. TaxID=28214 RepID=UPI002E300C8F|nr:aminotransferase class V-fold PLP-dependent enzyme [Sphingomonas sp.]HEX4694470.1 aminotransferase class V-fold PLP-dependent enzyme [Sphingomonas sp.]